MVNEQDLSKYIRQAGKGCPFFVRKRLTAELRSNLSDFLDAHPEYTMEDVRAHFGVPEKFADEYLLTLDESTRQKYIHSAKFIKWSCISVSVAIILIMKRMFTLFTTVVLLAVHFFRFETLYFFSLFTKVCLTY